MHAAKFPVNLSDLPTWPPVIKKNLHRAPHRDPAGNSQAFANRSGLWTRDYIGLSRNYYDRFGTDLDRVGRDRLSLPPLSETLLEFPLE